MAELLVALGQGKPRSAPGHDVVTRHRNLPAVGHDALLKLISSSWEQSQVDDHLKLTIIHPIPKPGKGSRQMENLLPIALTLTMCKLIEHLINNRLSFGTNSMVSPGTNWFPAQSRDLRLPVVPTRSY